MERVLSCTVADQCIKNVEAALRNQLGLSRRQVSRSKFLDHGICKNGVPCGIHEYVSIGDQVSIKIEEDTDNSMHLIPLKGDLDVLYEDQDMIIVNKPSGIAVHPANGHYKDTLVNILAYYFEQKQEPVKIRVVGRLDLETSGAIVFAKNHVAAARLMEQKQEGIFIKEYLAIVSGTFDHQTGCIDAAIGPIPGIMNRMQTSPDGKPAKTCYKVVQEITSTNENTESQNDQMSMVRVQIYTGRTHQIRVHMASIGHPLIGDSFYHTNPRLDLIGRAALHAETIQLKQPFSGEVIKVHAPLPEDMQRLL